MNILLSGLFLILLAFLIHLVVWKIHLPKRQTPALLGIFFGAYFFAILFFELILPTQYHSSLLPQGFLEYIHVFLFFTSFTLAYIITYSAIEVDSPSLVVTLKIAEAGAEGLERSKLIETMNDDVLVRPRINDLIADKMAYIEGNKYKLTSKGFLMLSVITLYRKMLNEGKGG